MVVGQEVYVGGPTAGATFGGYYHVGSVSGSTSARLILDTSGGTGAATGATIGATSGVSPAGLSGASGATGATGPTGPTGPTGSTGPTGPTGLAGINAYTATTAGYTQPTVGGSVDVLIVQNGWMVVGQEVYVGGPTAGGTAGGD